MWFKPIHGWQLVHLGTSFTMCMYVCVCKVRFRCCSSDFRMALRAILIVAIPYKVEEKCASLL